MAQTAPQEPDGRRGRPWYVWLGVGTFVLGLLVGVLALGLLREGTAAESVRQVEPGSGEQAPSPSGGGTAGIRVNEACLRAINAARDIGSVVEDLGTAAAALDTAQLDEAIRRLQPLQERLEQNSATCETVGAVSGEDVTAPSSVPAPASPTA
jgi:hypothetical protein